MKREIKQIEPTLLKRLIHLKNEIDYVKSLIGESVLTRFELEEKLLDVNDRIEYLRNEYVSNNNSFNSIIDTLTNNRKGQIDIRTGTITYVD